MLIDITINGQAHQLDIHPGTLLLDLLRESGLPSLRDSDAALVDGKVIHTGIYLAAQAHKRTVLTVEGLNIQEPVQAAILETCASFDPPMLLAAYELLSGTPNPTEADAQDALAGTSAEVARVLQAAQRIREGRGALSLTAT